MLNNVFFDEISALGMLKSFSTLPCDNDYSYHTFLYRKYLNGAHVSPQAFGARELYCASSKSLSSSLLSCFLSFPLSFFIYFPYSSYFLGPAASEYYVFPVSYKWNDQP